MRPALSHPTGVGAYLQNLVQALSEIDQQNEYHLFSSSWKERYRPVHYPPHFKIQDRRWPVRLLNFGWNHLSFPSIEFVLGTPVQVVHSPTPLVIPSRRARRVTTVHDLYFYTHPEQTVREMKEDYPRMIKKHCLRSDAVIAVSDHTKRALVEVLGIPSSRIYTIKHGIDSFFLDRVPVAQTNEVLERLAIRGPYLLFVGTQEPRKNLSLLVRAYRNLNVDVSLVIAGSHGWGMESTDFPKGVLLTGYLPKNDLRAVYQRAAAVVFPSIEEGFGLPLLEGMASEVPVIASRISAFQEVCNDSCLYFDPNSEEELIEQIRLVLHGNGLRENLIAKGRERVKKFSWKDAARKTLDLYLSL
ncbi:glycosyltransferase family 4 protein [bacterium]|nr:glycosyltransferase family 4 protein [bacterium]